MVTAACMWRSAGAAHLAVSCPLCLTFTLPAPPYCPPHLTALACALCRLLTQRLLWATPCCLRRRRMRRSRPWPWCRPCGRPLTVRCLRAARLAACCPVGCALCRFACTASSLATSRTPLHICNPPPPPLSPQAPRRFRCACWHAARRQCWAMPHQTPRSSSQPIWRPGGCCPRSWLAHCRLPAAPAAAVGLSRKFWLKVQLLLLLLTS